MLRTHRIHQTPRNSPEELQAQPNFLQEQAPDLLVEAALLTEEARRLRAAAGLVLADADHQTESGPPTSVPAARSRPLDFSFLHD